MCLVVSLASHPRVGICRQHRCGRGEETASSTGNAWGERNTHADSKSECDKKRKKRKKEKKREYIESGLLKICFVNLYCKR